MTTLKYALGRALCRFVTTCCVRWVVLHRERMDRAGGYVLACSHLSHVEPFLVAALMDRQVEYMARIEFYRYRLFAWVMNAMDAFPVNRQGVSVSAIRTSIDRVKRGRVVGIFPEGGVARGIDSVLRGGPIKKGACVVAYRGDVPIVPVVVVGTEALTRVGPWLPFKHARIWVNFGRPIYPRLDLHRRVARETMAREVQAEFQSLYQELCSTCGLEDPTLNATVARA